MKKNLQNVNKMVNKIQKLINKKPLNSIKTEKKNQKIVKALNFLVSKVILKKNRMLLNIT